MTDLEIGHLELLLYKLRDEVGGRIVIIPATHQDLVQLGTYDNKGLPIKQVTAPSLKEAIEKIKE